MISALPGSVEAQVIRGSTVKRLLIAYFIGSISAKISKSVHVCKVMASQRWDVLWDAVYIKHACKWSEAKWEKQYKVQSIKM